MSLYLCIFDGDEEITGWVLGHYSDFGYFRRRHSSEAGSGQLSNPDAALRLRRRMVASGISAGYAPN